MRVLLHRGRAILVVALLIAMFGVVSSTGAGAASAGSGGKGCTDTFLLDAPTNGWGNNANWSKGLVPGAADFACIPAGYGEPVVMGAGDGGSIRGINAQNPGGLEENAGGMTLTDPTHASIIRSLTMGDPVLTVDAGVVLNLVGAASIAGSAPEIDGPGTVEIVPTATVTLGAIVYFRQGLQIVNDGTIAGHGGGLSQDSAAAPALLENFGAMNLTNGGFGHCSFCSGPGSVVNESSGTIAVAAGSGQSFVLTTTFDNFGHVTVQTGALAFGAGNSGTNVDTGTYRTNGAGNVDLETGRDLTHATLLGSGTYTFDGSTPTNLADPTLANVVQCGTTTGGMIITKSLLMTGCETGATTQTDLGTPTTTEIEASATASFTGGFGEMASTFAGGHHLVVHGTVDDDSTICLKAGATISNTGKFTMAGNVQGCGDTTGGSMVNQHGGTVTNTGANDEIAVAFDNLGSVVNSAGFLDESGNVTGDFSTGSWHNAKGASLQFEGVTTLSSSSKLLGQGSYAVDCHGGTLNLSGQAVTNLMLFGTASGQFTATNLGFGGEPACDDGVIDIPSGVVTVNGNYSPFDATHLEPTINSRTNFGKITVTGTAALANEVLVLNTKPSFTPSIGQVFPILSAASVTGTFVLNDPCLPSVGEHAGYSMSYSKTRAKATVVSSAPGC